MLAMLTMGALSTTGATWAQTPAGEAAAGAGKNSMCVGCHGISGYKTAFPEVYNVPKIGGQHAAYIVKALQAYKSGERKNPIMAPMGANLSQRDIEELAAYYSQQQGLVTFK